MADFWRDLTGTVAYTLATAAPLRGYDVSAYDPLGPTLRQGARPDPWWPNATVHAWSSNSYCYELWGASLLNGGVWEFDTYYPLHRWFSDITQTLYIDGLVANRHGFYYGYPATGTAGITLNNVGYGVTFYTGHYSSYAATPPASITVELRNAMGVTTYHSIIGFTKGAAVLGEPSRWYTTCVVQNIVGQLVLNLAPTEYKATGISVS